MSSTGRFPERRRRHFPRDSRRSTQPISAAATGLLPGANAWRAEHRGLAVLVFLITVVSVLGGVLLVSSVGGALHTVVSPGALTILGAINLTILGLRLGEVGLLHRTVGRHALQSPPRTARRRERSHLQHRHRRALKLTAVAVLLPHLAIGWQLEIIRRTVVETFPVVSSVEAAQARTRPPVIAPAEHEGAVPPPLTPESLDSTGGTLDILLIGLDAGAGRTGARNDANLVVSIDPRTADVTLIGIPRNLVQVPLPSSDDDCRCYRPPLYSLYEHGLASPDNYPAAADPGAEAVREAAAALLGRTIEWYLVADLVAFQHLVDAVGGIEIEVSEQVRGSWSDPADLSERIAVDIDPGQHLLDGSAALAYARVRADSDDYRRMARQRCLVASASETAKNLSVGDALTLLESSRGTLFSDIPRTTLPALVDLVQEVERDRIASIGLVPPDYISGRVNGYPVPDVDVIRRTLSSGSSAEVVPRKAQNEC